jgi:hypothetical protein
VSTEFIKSRNIDFHVAIPRSRKLLLALVSTVILVCGSRGTHAHIHFCLTSLRIVQLTSENTLSGSLVVNKRTDGQTRRVCAVFSLLTPVIFCRHHRNDIFTSNMAEKQMQRHRVLPRTSVGPKIEYRSATKQISESDSHPVLAFCFPNTHLNVILHLFFGLTTDRFRRLPQQNSVCISCLPYPICLFVPPQPTDNRYKSACRRRDAGPHCVCSSRSRRNTLRALTNGSEALLQVRMVLAILLPSHKNALHVTMHGNNDQAGALT